MLKVENDIVEFRGSFIDILSELAALTQHLVERSGESELIRDILNMAVEKGSTNINNKNKGVN